MISMKKNETDTESDKILLTAFVQERMEMSEREAKLIAENMLEIQRDLLAGAQPDKILNAIQKFLSDFSGDTGVLEQKFLNKQNRIRKIEKKKAQIDFFSPGEK